jgi:hypothetical protein
VGGADGVMDAGAARGVGGIMGAAWGAVEAVAVAWGAVEVGEVADDRAMRGRAV